MLNLNISAAQQPVRLNYFLRCMSPHNTSCTNNFAMLHNNHCGQAIVNEEACGEMAQLAAENERLRHELKLYHALQTVGQKQHYAILEVPVQWLDFTFSSS